ncbi:c-type cytochrome [Flavihumibacter petaseus]|uniref:Putative cytochrome c n=1 Tax=Flavihumibacter petaseus NBRC 106054 TaxID=1220578 RepID=A0A0E9N0H1_9BACT|nr:c-type cytochrome [Flavihumibacter petaseus]GAO43492.1 putative cytochrome c [Flavihumibacter petaseus NBRC 106054]
MIKKILIWVVAVIAVLIGGVTVATGFRQHLTYEAPLPAIRASKDSAVIQRGRHIVLGPGHCADCHSTTPNKDSILIAGGDPVLSGGYAFNLPFGNFYTRNLTPDKETGLGNRSDAEVARIIRYGVHANGEMVLPFMPFQQMTDSDLEAVISYLRSVPAVHNKVHDHEYNSIGKVLRAFVLKPVGPSEAVKPYIKPDTTADYGRYLTMNIANCNECHTKRDGTGNFVGEPLAGGNPFEEEGLPPLTPPNLTPDSSSRLFGWSQEMFIQRFRMGKLIAHSHMPWTAFGKMTDDELKAIYKYLRTVKPAKTAVN